MQLSAPLLLSVVESASERLANLQLKITPADAYELGLKEGQIIRALYSPVDNQVKLFNATAAETRSINSTGGYHTGSFWFQVRFSAYGVYLQPYNGHIHNVKTAVIQPATHANGGAGELTSAKVLSNIQNAIEKPWQSDISKLDLSQILRALNLNKVVDSNVRALLSRIVFLDGNINAQAIFNALRFGGLFPGVSRKDFPNLQEIVKQLLMRGAENLELEQVDFDLLTSILQRLQSGQMEMLQARANGEIYYRFAFVFDEKYPVDVLLSRKSKQSKKGEAFSADFIISTDSADQIQINCVLIEQRKLSVSAWIPKKEIANQMRSRIPELIERLKEHSIALTSCAVFESVKPSAKGNYANLHEQNWQLSL